MANLFSLRKDPLAFFQQLHREYGDLVRFDMGPRNYHLVCHPHLITEVLTTQDRHFSKWFAVERIRQLLGNGLFVSEGDWHRRQRKLVQPAFHRERISSYAESMIRLTCELSDRWRNGETLDLGREMNWLTMMIVAETLFGANVDSVAQEIASTLTAILDQFERSTLAEDEEEDFQTWKSTLDATVQKIISNRREDSSSNPPKRLDLLSMLLEVRDEETGEGLTDQEIRDEVMTIFLAGHETTANALTWTWHLLSQNPEIEREFYQQIDRVLQGREPGLGDVSQLGYLEGVFAEAMRLYPPVWAIGRQAMRDVSMGGYLIPAGSVAIICLYLTHRDARFFPEPERFDPSRWIPEMRETRPRHSYLPFSAGSRQCLGEGFAWMEGILILAILGQRWRFEKPAGSPPIALQPQLTLRPRNGLPMIVRART